ncbi:hypothetical protein IJD44_09010 [bacterium]|nr:hypothetical protein [bacterium]
MKQKGFIDFIFIILALCLIFFSLTEVDLNPQKRVDANTVMHEKDYVQKYCSGNIEYVLPDKTRIDCLTDEYAIEFDYAKKWAESIGQSLYYAKKTGKKPAVAIILKKESDKKYVKRIKDIDLGLTIFQICSIDYVGKDKSKCVDEQIPLSSK